MYLLAANGHPGTAEAEILVDSSCREVILEISQKITTDHEIVFLPIWHWHRTKPFYQIGIGIGVERNRLTKLALALA